MQTITPADVAALGRVTIIDVREPAEVAAVRVADSVAIPMSAFVERIDEVPHDETVYVLCAAGGRSAQVAGYLEQRGYDAVNIVGGIVAWEAAGLPVQRP